MVRAELHPLSELYLSDETAWLDRMAEAAATGDESSLDMVHLAEYLADMAIRERREVVNRLIVLLIHLLKWDAQPDQRTRSWELTMTEQREELQELLQSGTLRNHAEAEYGTAYRKAVRRAAVETDLSESDFPAECPWSLGEAVGIE